MKLLISVRSRPEAEAALAGGADIIDAKEPATGALGPVTIATFATIVAAAGRATVVSAALGDAADERQVETGARAFADAGAAFVKLGFAGITDGGRIVRLIAAAKQGASRSHASVIAVAYADHDRVDAAGPALIVDLATAGGADGVLLDTAMKDGPGVRGLLSDRALRDWVNAVHAAGMSAAVAGRLGETDLGALMHIGADIAGVRGAACDGGRNGTVTVARVRRLAELLRSPTTGTSSSPGRAAAHDRSTDPRSMRPGHQLT